MAFDATGQAFGFTGPDVSGRVIFHAPDGDLAIRFDWEAIKALQVKWAADDEPNAYLSKVSAGIDSLSIEDLSEIVAASTGKTVSEIMSASYPLRPLQAATVAAWSYAWNGGEPVEDDDPAGKMKTPAASFVRRARQRLGQVFRGANSGA